MTKHYLKWRKFFRFCPLETSEIPYPLLHFSNIWAAYVVGVPFSSLNFFFLQLITPSVLNHIIYPRFRTPLPNPTPSSWMTSIRNLLPHILFVIFCVIFYYSFIKLKMEWMLNLVSPLIIIFQCRPPLSRFLSSFALVFHPHFFCEFFLHEEAEASYFIHHKNKTTTWNIYHIS